MSIDPHATRVPGLFMHIQKTAGTSIVKVLKKHYQSDMTSHGDFIGHLPDALAHITMISGHFGFAFAEPLLPGRFSFTILRDPVERILSLYAFAREQPAAEFSIYSLAQKLSLSDFLLAARDNLEITKHVQDNLVWQLARGYYHKSRGYHYNFGKDGSYQIIEENHPTIKSYSETQLLNLAKAHLNQLSFVGFVETFHNDFKVIMRNLKINNFCTPPNANQSGRKKYSILSDRDREILHQLTRLDRQLYTYARALYPT